MRKHWNRELEKRVKARLSLEQSPLSVLELLLIEDADWTERNSKLAEIYYGQISRAGTPNTKTVRDSISLIFQKALRLKMLESSNLNTLTDFVFGVHIHTQVAWLMNVKTKTLSDNMREVIDLMMNGIRS